MGRLLNGGMDEVWKIDKGTLLIVLLATAFSISFLRQPGTAFPEVALPTIREGN